MSAPPSRRTSAVAKWDGTCTGRGMPAAKQPQKSPTGHDDDWAKPRLRWSLNLTTELRPRWMGGQIQDRKSTRRIIGTIWSVVLLAMSLGIFIGSKTELNDGAKTCNDSSAIDLSLQQEKLQQGISRLSHPQTTVLAALLLVSQDCCAQRAAGNHVCRQTETQNRDKEGGSIIIIKPLPKSTSRYARAPECSIAPRNAGSQDRPFNR